MRKYIMHHDHYWNMEAIFFIHNIIGKEYLFWEYYSKENKLNEKSIERKQFKRNLN
jgi:hypothetical protein